MKKIKYVLAVLSVSLLCGCGASSESGSSIAKPTRETVKEAVTETVKEEKKQIKVEVPSHLYATIDGDYGFISWQKAENATGYEVDLGDGPKKIQLNMLAHIFTPGEQLTFKVRGYNDTEETVYSDWAILNIACPSISLKDMSRFGAAALSRSRFEEWVKLNKYECEVVEDENCYRYCIKIEDKDNKGVLNKIKRTGAAAWKSFWDGFSETVENETADGETIVKGILQNRGFKNYIDDVDESATFEGGWRAVAAAWNAMKVEAEYVYYYYFPKDSDKRASFLVERHFLQSHHEDYAKNTAKDEKTVEINGQTYYTYISKDCGHRINYAVAEETVQGVKRWVDYIYAENLSFE